MAPRIAARVCATALLVVLGVFGDLVLYPALSPLVGNGPAIAFTVLIGVAVSVVIVVVEEQAFSKPKERRSPPAPGSTGILLEGGEDNVVEGNTILGAKTGIHAKGEKRLRANNNTVESWQSGGEDERKEK